MSINRYAARRDGNEQAIVRDLEKVGAVVERLKWPCDLAVRFRYQHFLIEVENPATKYRQRDPKQLEVLRRLGIPVVKCSDEALRIIGAM